MFLVNVDNTVGAVGFLPKLVPTCLHPIALVRADEQGQLVRGPDGYCIRCKPSESCLGPSHLYCHHFDKRNAIFIYIFVCRCFFSKIIYFNGFMTLYT